MSLTGVYVVSCIFEGVSYVAMVGNNIHLASIYINKLIRFILIFTPKINTMDKYYLQLLNKILKNNNNAFSAHLHYEFLPRSSYTGLTLNVRVVLSICCEFLC